MYDPHHIQINGINCVLHPQEVLEGSRRTGAPIDGWWRRANSINIPVGKKSGIATLLVTRDFADAIDRAGLHTIKWRYCPSGASSSEEITLSEWVLIRAECVGVDGDTNAAYVLEFADKRYLMAKAYARYVKYNTTLSTTNEYAKGENFKYANATLNSGSLWTWQEMLENLWAGLPANAGPCPTLSWTPPHKPHNFNFFGVQVWDAIFDVLETCHSTLYLESGTTFRLIELGLPQNNLAADFTALAARQLYDSKSQEDVERATCPKNITIYSPQHRSASTDVKPPLQWWESRDLVWTPYNTNIPDSEGYLEIFCDLPAEISVIDGEILNLDDLSASNAAIVAKVVTRMNNQPNAIWRQYGGLCTKPILGSQIHRIVLRDYGDGYGLITEFASDWGLRFPDQSKFREITSIRDVPPGCYLAKTPTSGIPGKSSTTLGSAECDLYYIDKDDVIHEWVDANSDNITQVVKNASESAVPGGVYIPIHQEMRTGRFLAGSSNALVELCLKDDHPGRGVAFDAYPGYWSSASNGWVYTCYTSVKAIDWREGTPYPDAGARGLFIARPSDDYGVIYECVSLDCSSPGSCCPA